MKKTSTDFHFITFRIADFCCSQFLRKFYILIHLIRGGYECHGPQADIGEQHKSVLSFHCVGHCGQTKVIRPGGKR